MKTLWEWVSIVLFFIFVVPIIALLGLVALLLAAIWAPFASMQQRAFKRNAQAYIASLEGANFFCYNNRKSSQAFIESEILPLLPSSVDVVFLDGKRVESAYTKHYISHMLYSLKHYAGYPHLIRIRNGKVEEKSINNQFFNHLRDKQPMDGLLDEISTFFATTKQLT